MKKKAVFLDRDGTVIIDKIYLNDPSQIDYLPGVFEALRQLQEAGFIFVIVTNQSGVARGIVQIENIEKIHEIISRDFAQHGVHFAGFYYAPYSVESNHPMRKPNPGMLEAGAKEHGIDLSQSWMIGDRMTDVEAGLRAGTKTVLLAGHEVPPEGTPRGPDFIAHGLMEAAQWILKSRG
ncbi:MAG: HAD family hydrolase [Bdellovibrionaceae bacterium]|nr:HAD family hydrolase [Pseudobdellovibrionaceae bacterium]